MLSSTIPDRYVRPVIAFVIFASGLKYVGLQTTALGWTLCALLFAAGGTWLYFARPWQTKLPVSPTHGVEPDGQIALVDGGQLVRDREN
jgi:hypothetical protein